MRSKFPFLLLLGASLLALGACSSDEPEPAPAAQPAAAPADEPLPAMDDMSALNAAPKAPAAQAAPQQASAPALQPGSSGRYVLQVSVWDNPASAKKHVRDLDALGIPAYVVKVENPGGLEGEFWRVRVGFFKTVPEARAYGNEVLTARGLGFWIYNRANDEVGDPNSEHEAPPAQESAPASSDWQEQPAQEPAPAAEPAPAPEPEPAPAAAEPAPAQEAAPAAEPVAVSDDGWD
ncbi:MAG: SPOR domain-containing protein [Fibrobacterales bacterium]|nr:SPOR domain-containing protein [Fibrobacterales bacterium]